MEVRLKRPHIELFVYLCLFYLFVLHFEPIDRMYTFTFFVILSPYLRQLHKQFYDKYAMNAQLIK